MERNFILLFFMVVCVALEGKSQLPTANQVLDRAIAFHDPNDRWSDLKASFKVVMESPNRPRRTSTISMDFPQQEFTLEESQAGDINIYQMSRNTCIVSVNGTEKNTEAETDACDRGKTMKNYYTYLYGLPMKLKDPGTNLDEKVQKKTFKGKEYLVLKVTYDAEVGKDIWYFYFSPKNYAMEVYQFFHDEGKNDGEYILLEGLENIHDIKIPKIRAWYMNKDNTYLGTDTLEKIAQ